MGFFLSLGLKQNRGGWVKMSDPQSLERVTIWKLGESEAEADAQA